MYIKPLIQILYGLLNASAVLRRDVSLDISRSNKPSIGKGPAKPLMCWKTKNQKVGLKSLLPTIRQCCLHNKLHFVREPNQKP